MIFISTSFVLSILLSGWRRKVGVLAAACCMHAFSTITSSVRLHDAPHPVSSTCVSESPPCCWSSLCWPTVRSQVPSESCVLPSDLNSISPALITRFFLRRQINSRKEQLSPSFVCKLKSEWLVSEQCSSANGGWFEPIRISGEATLQCRLTCWLTWSCWL